MGSKIDELEKSINDLIDEAGIESSNDAAKKENVGRKIRNEAETSEL